MLHETFVDDLLGMPSSTWGQYQMQYSTICADILSYHNNPQPKNTRGNLHQRLMGWNLSQPGDLLSAETRPADVQKHLYISTQYHEAILSLYQGQDERGTSSTSNEAVELAKAVLETSSRQDVASATPYL